MSLCTQTDRQQYSFEPYFWKYNTSGTGFAKLQIEADREDQNRFLIYGYVIYISWYVAIVWQISPFELTIISYRFFNFAGVFTSQMAL